MKAYFISALLLSGCSVTPTEISAPNGNSDKAVIFDIDGTLTPCNACIFSERENASELVQTYADNGFKIIYLTARNVYFQFNIPFFLSLYHFPDGDIQVANSMAERKNFKTFKLNILKRYTESGWTLFAAYGDSSTDFAAYLAAGVPQNKIFAITRQGDCKCKPGPWRKCYDSWSKHTPIAFPP